MQEKDHDARARKLLEQVFGKEEAQERMPGEVIVEKEQRGFYPLEVIEFLLGDREPKNNAFEGTEKGFDVYIIRTSVHEDNLFICFSWQGDFLHIGLSSVKSVKDDPARGGAKVYNISRERTPYSIHLADILRVGFCIEVKPNGEKMRFVQFDVQKGADSFESLRVYDHGEILKLPP